VEAEVQLKARLDNVRAIFSEVLATLQDNPQFFRDASGAEYQTHESAEEPVRGALGAGEPSGADGAVTGATDARRTREEATNATNVAKETARELGLDLSTLEGTGSGGRITLRDVEKAARG
jgi:pyruvate/2-oxoglutarate dehydrogenase complex dihydrolipoamide acyltransferase (E2) component